MKKTSVRFLNNWLGQLAFAMFAAVVYWLNSSNLVQAHVKWFSQPMDIVPNYSLLSPQVVIAIILCLLLIGLGLYLEKVLTVPKLVQNLADKWYKPVMSVVTIGAGVALVLFSLNNFLFAPNMVVGGDLAIWLLSAQALVGLMFIFGYYVRIAGIILFVLFMAATGIFGPVEILDALEILGLAVFAMLVGRPQWKVQGNTQLASSSRKWEEYGLPILRFATGLNLLVLGFSEKLLNPSLSQTFLSHYNWNFMQVLGFSWYSDYWFAFSAGVTEAIFGIFLIFGLVTRLTTLVLAIFLGTTLVLLGPIELMGHLPHFSIAIALLVLGSGSKLLLEHPSKK